MTLIDLEVSMDVMQEEFRAVMGRVATPVSVVTTMDGGEPFGSTVSAFASLSLDPPMVLVSLDHRSDLLTGIRRTGRFALNVLGSRHSGLARTFARKGGSAKFDNVRWETHDGMPRLPGADWISCDVTAIVRGGDHMVLMGTVRAVEAAEGLPLTYHRRTFGTHTELA